MSFTTLFFDLDDTLYPSGNGLWDAIGQRMNRFMIDRLKLPELEVPSIRRQYFEKYGTTMRGLQIHHAVDADEYLSYVHDLRLDQYLQPNPHLRSLLSSLPQKCWVFTNADAGHAGRVVAELGLQGCFDGIIDVRAIQFACKPEAIAYQRALELAGCPPPAECVMLDDSVRNLVPARQLGFSTVWVSRNGTSHPAAIHTLADLHQLPYAMPELWDLI
jgi:putative hydrolase of the HAD superfamily